MKDTVSKSIKSKELGIYTPKGRERETEREGEKEKIKLRS